MRCRDKGWSEGYGWDVNGRGLDGVEEARFEGVGVVGPGWGWKE